MQKITELSLYKISITWLYVAHFYTYGAPFFKAPAGDFHKKFRQKLTALNSFLTRTHNLDIVDKVYGKEGCTVLPNPDGPLCPASQIWSDHSHR